MNLCWRNDEQVGDHKHIFWDSPTLKSYWEGIHTAILAILDLDLPLHYYTVLCTDGKEKNYVVLPVMGGKKIITLSWLNPLPQALHQWQDRLMNLYFTDYGKIPTNELNPFSFYSPFCA